MTGSSRLLAVVVLLVALGVGVIAASLALTGRGGPSSLPASAPPPPSPMPTSTRSPTSTPSSTAVPSAIDGRPAEIAFASLKLDAVEDPDGEDRVITFQTEGRGRVSVRLSSVSPRGETILCLRSATTDAGCQTMAAGTITAPSPAEPTSFTLTLRGAGIDVPIVDIALTYPAGRPSVTIKDARFDGTGRPDSNGIDVTLTPREDGDIHLVGDWGGHPLLYDVDLAEVGGPGAWHLAEQGPDVGVDVWLPVTAANPWRLVLTNAEEGFGVTPMTATIAWP